MKNKTTIISLFLALGLFGACSKENPAGSSQAETAEYYSKILPSDPLFVQIALTWDEFITTGVQSCKTADTPQKQNEKMLKFQQMKTEEEAVKVYREEFFEPEKLIGLAKKKQMLTDAFRKEHQQFFTLDRTVQENILKNALDRIEFPAGKDEVQPSLPNSFKTSADCLSALRAEQDRCKRNGRIEAVGCGLLSETIIIALACGVFVIVHEEFCLRDAQENYDICTGIKK
jgi:hypothetical protein